MLATTIAGLLLSACQPDAVDVADRPVANNPQSHFCVSLVGNRYRSLGRHEVGRGPDGPAMGHWQIEFTTDQFRWRYSDVVESGGFQCSNNRLLLEPAVSQTRNGIVLMQGNRLSIDDIDYEKLDHVN